MVVAGVECQQEPARLRVPEVELVRSDRVALDADPEQLAFDRIEVEGGVDRLREHRVERLEQPLSRAETIDRRVLHAVRNPEVRDARRAQRPPHRRADPAARLPVRDPEVAHGPVAMRQREVVGGARVREERRVEVEADPQRLRPVDPRGEMFRPDRVAVHESPAEIAVRRVQVESMASRDERQRLGGVRAELVGACRLCPDSCRSRRCLRSACWPTARSRRRRRPASNGATRESSRSGPVPLRCRRRVHRSVRRPGGRLRPGCSSCVILSRVRPRAERRADPVWSRRVALRRSNQCHASVLVAS